MKYEFIKTSPTQNMTIIVKTAVPRAEQPKVAAELMSYDSLFAEQTGFWEEPTITEARARLQMMGGEFCGNASMSIAACIARDDGLKEGESESVVIEASGAEETVKCEVRKLNGAYECTVSMPLPVTFADYDSLQLVKMPGITHAIYALTDIEDAKAEAPNIVKKLAAAIDSDAVGLVLFNIENFEIAPLVYVKATDSMTWERGCGSGTAAVGAMVAMIKRGAAEMKIYQPGGMMKTRANWQDGKITALEITGLVKIVAEGCAYI